MNERGRGLGREETRKGSGLGEIAGKAKWCERVKKGTGDLYRGGQADRGIQG